MRTQLTLRTVLLASSLALAALGGSCGPTQPTSLVPSDYRSSFGITRACRGTIEHAQPAPMPPPTPISSIVVYVNPEATAAYNANANPLAAGTLVIKEEYDDTNCGHLVSWSIMHKEPGFDPDHGDWHFQHVLADGTIDADGRVERCNNASCHGASVCTARDWMCTVP
jgi:hypothetical protein